MDMSKDIFVFFVAQLCSFLWSPPYRSYWSLCTLFFITRGPFSYWWIYYSVHYFCSSFLVSINSLFTWKALFILSFFPVYLLFIMSNFVLFFNFVFSNGLGQSANDYDLKNRYQCCTVWRAVKQLQDCEFANSFQHVCDRSRWVSTSGWRRGSERWAYRWPHRHKISGSLQG